MLTPTHICIIAPKYANPPTEELSVPQYLIYSIF